MAKMATGYLYLNTRDELIRLDCSKIVYMEGDGNYTNIVLVNKQKVSVCMNLSHMQQFISESLRERASVFARIGKRFIVNLNYIYKVQPLLQSLVVTDGVHFTFQLGISKEALKQLKDILVGRVPNRTQINVE
ncbi:LytTR family transcriptional regulator DNA-binding domain-containing protein [Prevotella sp.]|jgi:DNA-binding LytR/AlgR family response regulator|uniref:LytTR family transcriptional regulator DNA-binding domain-containing protein n=2 Tax=uncultured Prevotella sp. TaxID=159272 RepID=UPI0025FFA626|nr:LytTR family DNA-binding domain-containing protein [Prevotella sp.]MEE0670146.1 LytTR family DNA-binding domain-containing protein [Prevotella sp.]